jgi:hypothetical protein
MSVGDPRRDRDGSRGHRIPSRPDRAGGLSGQVGLPFGLEAPERETEAVGGRERPTRQTKTCVLGPTVLLSGIAPSARRNDVVPAVRAALGPRDDVIEVLGRTAAVLAGPRVAGEESATGQRGVRPERHVHEMAQTDDRWRLDLVSLGAKYHPVRYEHLGLVLQDEDDCPPGRDHCKRLMRRVEYERSSHGQGAASIASAPAWNCEDACIARIPMLSFGRRRRRSIVPTLHPRAPE